MAEEIKKEEPAQQTDMFAGESQTPERDAWMAGMKGKYPDLGDDEEALYKASREGYDKEHNLNKENADAYNKIYDGIGRSPEVAAFVNELVYPEDGAYPEEAIANFGDELRQLITGEIDRPTYRAKRKEIEDKKAAEAEMDKKAGEAFALACQESGLDVEETYKKISEKYGDDDAMLANKDFYTAIIKSLTYDDDIAAAELRGRNANVAEKKAGKGGGDGLPRSGSAAPQGAKYNPNSLAAMAEQRRRMNS